MSSNPGRKYADWSIDPIHDLVKQTGGVVMAETGISNPVFIRRVLQVSLPHVSNQVLGEAWTLKRFSGHFSVTQGKPLTDTLLAQRADKVLRGPGDFSGEFTRLFAPALRAFRDLFRVDPVPKYLRDPRRTFSDAEQAAAMLSTDNVCPCCGAEFTESVVPTGGHIKPHESGGRTVPTNQVVLCADCNRDQSSKCLLDLMKSRFRKVSPKTDRLKNLQKVMA